MNGQENFNRKIENGKYGDSWNFAILVIATWLPQRPIASLYENR